MLRLEHREILCGISARWADLDGALRTKLPEGSYNPALLPLAYGRPLRRELDRGDEIAAVGDAFTLDDIPLHRMDALRLRVAANALERLPAFLEAGRDRAVRRAGMLERAGAEVLRDDPGGEGVWPFFMVLMPDRDRRDRALGALWRSGLGVSKLFVRALPDYPYLAGAVEGGPCPAARAGGKEVTGWSL